MSNSTINITIPPPEIAVNREVTSCTKACGSRAMIPIIMINEIPFPTPLSVMRSPSHKINILPAARITVAETIKAVQETPLAKAWPACVFRFMRYAGP